MANLKKLSPEVLIPRIGDFLISRGLITNLDVEKALAIQQVSRSKGESPLLGQVLIQMGAITKEQLDHVITEQIMNLRTALEEANKDLEIKIHQRTDELERAYRKVTELGKQKSNFIANISHELRTPLTHIKGYLGMWSENQLGSMTEDQKKAVKVMISSSDRLEKLIDNLILFSMVDQGNVHVDSSLIELNELLARVVDQISARFQSNSVSLSTAFMEPKIQLLADPQKLSWAINELLSNSLKFTPRGGKVLLKTTLENHQPTISISDTGIGISQDKLDVIFEPFYQADGSATRKYGGTGLGLALVKQIIAAHHGTITVDSVPQQGTNFVIHLEPKD